MNTTGNLMRVVCVLAVAGLASAATAQPERPRARQNDRRPQALQQRDAAPPARAQPQECPTCGAVLGAGRDRAPAAARGPGRGQQGPGRGLAQPQQGGQFGGRARGPGSGQSADRPGALGRLQDLTPRQIERLRGFLAERGGRAQGGVRGLRGQAPGQAQRQGGSSRGPLGRQREFGPVGRGGLGAQGGQIPPEIRERVMGAIRERMGQMQGGRMQGGPGGLAPRGPGGFGPQSYQIPPEVRERVLGAIRERMGQRQGRADEQFGQPGPRGQGLFNRGEEPGDQFSPPAEAHDQIMQRLRDRALQMRERFEEDDGGAADRDDQPRRRPGRSQI